MPLKDKIEERTAKIGVIGLGYVGLPLAVEFANSGFEVVGVDVARKRVENLNSGSSYIDDAPSSDLVKVIKKGLFRATTDYGVVSELDVINICVPTPFTKSKDPDISYIVNSSQQISKYLKKEKLIILRSTTFPETTEKIVLPILERNGLKVGRDFFLAFAPERIDPGNKIYTTKNTPVVVGGVTPKCSTLASALLKKIVDKVVPVSSPRVAEMTKLLENIYRSVNIALVNELACLCERMGNVDIWEVIDAASTKPFGFMPFYPGPGIGGHCILVDPYYLSWKAKEYDFHTNFIELAAETNENMPFHVMERLIEGLSERGLCASKAKILILGVAFKKDVSDTRNSPALKLIELLKNRVAKLTYNDPYVPEISVNGVSYRSFELTANRLKSADCVLIATAHSSYDYKWIAKHARFIFDTRNATKDVKHPSKILKLGNPLS